MEIINVKEKDGKQLVSARELHEFLEIGRDFTTWIKERISKYEFVENYDYTVIRLIHQNGGINSKGGDRKSKDYLLTIEMAKELSILDINQCY